MRIIVDPQAVPISDSESSQASLCSLAWNDSSAMRQTAGSRLQQCHSQNGQGVCESGNSRSQTAADTPAAQAAVLKAGSHQDGLKGSQRKQRVFSSLEAAIDAAL